MFYIKLHNKNFFTIILKLRKVGFKSFKYINMKKIIAITASAVMPFVAFAQTAPTAPTVIQSYGDVVRVINTIGNWMFGLLLALAAIFITYAAFLYLTAAGDEKKVGTAKDIIIYAIVAIVVAILAKGIIIVVQSLLGTNPVIQ